MYTSPRYGCKVLWWVCLFFCLSVLMLNSKVCGQTSSNFLCMLPAVMAWSFSNGITLLYIHLILQIMSCIQCLQCFDTWCCHLYQSAAKSVLKILSTAFIAYQNKGTWPITFPPYQPVYWLVWAYSKWPIFYRVGCNS